MNFIDYKERVLKKAKEKNACNDQYLRAVDAETLDDLIEVIIDNKGWCFNNIGKCLDCKALRDKIKDNCIAYLYCRFIDDRKSVRDLITESYDAYVYCRFVKDKKSIRDLITDSRDAYFYCRHVKNRKSVRDKITDSWYLSIL
jgi:hypothetical protein